MKNKKLLLWSLTVALSGFLFGLDTAVISGAEQKIQALWSLSDAMHGLAIAIALYGTVFGAAFGGWYADKLGRKKALFWLGALFFISAVGSAVAQDVYTFMLFRFIGGLCIGASSVVSPLYISEIAPAKNRGFLVALFQFNIVFGIMIAYVSNYFFQTMGGESDWRWMLGIVGIPSLIFTGLTTLIPESPRWLILKRNEIEQARTILKEIDLENAESIISRVIELKNKSTGDNRLISSKSKAFPFSIGVFRIINLIINIFKSKYRFPILLAFLMAFFNQVSGINAIIYYAPRVFEMAGLAKSSALLSSVGIGLTNLIFTMLGVTLIDKLGRRTLMFIGSIGYIISLSLIARAFYIEQFDGMTFFVFAFIAAHAIGQGAVIWVFISEIFPNEVRASGQAFGSLTHWVFAAIITNVFPYFAGKFGGTPIFISFAVMMCCQLLYVWFMMPETKGVALEDMDVRVGH